jgi:hypothetical protein
MTSGKFQLERVKGTPVSDEELLSDLRVVANELGIMTVPQKKYREVGKYDDTTLSNRFGSWNKALIKAGLELSNENNISDEKLFENILRLWEYYGRQPRRRELALKPSTISKSPYNRRFGSWSDSLQAFVEYANTNEVEGVEASMQSAFSDKRKTSRDPSLRLRWKVLQRDNFKCCACGASPAITLGIELHVDHIKAWSNRGETVLDNLQTLCSKCNLGKSNET